MPRKRNKTPSIIYQIKLTLNPEMDKDLIEFLSDVPSYRRAKAVKSAMRSGNMRNFNAEENDGIENLIDDLFV